VYLDLLLQLIADSSLRCHRQLDRSPGYSAGRDTTGAAGKKFCPEPPGSSSLACQALRRLDSPVEVIFCQISRALRRPAALYGGPQVARAPPWGSFIGVSRPAVHRCQSIPRSDGLMA